MNAFINTMKVGDVVMSCYSSRTIDAIGIVTGEYEWHDNLNTINEYVESNGLLKI